MAEILAVLLYIITLVPQPVDVTLTSYTCERDPRNPMSAPGMCIETAHGADPAAPGIACPRSWEGRRYFLPGHGLLICDDVPRDETLFGYAHVDVRVATYDLARAVSIGTHTIYHIKEVHETNRNPATAVPPRKAHLCKTLLRAHALGSLPAVHPVRSCQLQGVTLCPTFIGRSPWVLLSAC